METFENVILASALLTSLAWLVLGYELRSNTRRGTSPVLDRSTSNTLMIAATMTGLTLALFVLFRGL